MKTGKYIATSDGWNVLSRSWKGLSAKLRLALILMTALSVTSCRSKREAVRTIAHVDSTAIVKTTLIRQTTPIPSFKTKLDIPLDAASTLPEKAVYMAEESGLTLTLERKDSTLHIMAETDCIMQEVTEEYTDTSMYSLSRKENKENTRGKMPWYWGIIAFLLFILIIKTHFSANRNGEEF